ncbi:MAG TPA: proprotein convertase P-domain-containing protein [Steroidobacteraceae bacterium]|nr:proprotein convertase P-domain-containing protein [Steroidobacteraceae bacterium]
MNAIRGVLLSGFVALAVVACGGGGQSNLTTPGASDAPPDPVAAADLPASATAQMKAILDEKAARTPAQQKISSQLLYAKSGKFPALKRLQKGETAKPGDVVSLLRYDDQGRVLADLKGDTDAGLQMQIEIAGGTVVSSSTAHHSARAWLPLPTLESLASQPAVRSIRPALAVRTNRADPPYASGKYSHLTYDQRVANAQAALKELAEARANGESAAKLAPANAQAADTAEPNAGSVNSGGGAAHGTDRARKFYGVDGTGVIVGVLSDSDDFKEASIASGDLPADTFTIPGQSGRPGSGEGTAIMEIVHDLAPGAKIVFATAFNSPESFADNIRQLRFTYHADVIVDDVQYYFESPYQDDIVAAAVADVVADGATYYSSAGNSGNFDDGTSGTWEGDFKSGGTLSTIGSGYQVHDFGKKVITNRVEVGGDPIVLHWADPGSVDDAHASNDYDLFILSPDLLNVVAASTDIQDGVGADDLPFEFIDATIPADYRVVVAAKSGAAVRAIHLELFDGELGLSTSGATYGHAAGKDAFAIGAVDASSAPNGGEFVAGPTTQVELYSSDGNRTIFYNRDNSPLDPAKQATFDGSAGEVRKKPEVSAADGVATTLPSTSGLNPFFGTSAAVAHAGAIAALLKSAVPTAPNTKIYSSLKSGALDIEAAGNDIDSGAGVLEASNALQKVGAKPAVFLELGTVTIISSTGSSVLPGTSGSLSIQLVNNGGLAPTAVTGVLTSSTPGVTIGNGTSTYPNIASGGSGANNTPYTFTVDASVPCGTRINLTLSVGFTGRGKNPTVFGISLVAGHAGGTISTAYTGGRVAIPDGNATGVNIPITLTNVGLINDLAFSIDGATCTATQGATTVGVDHSWVGDLTFTLTSPSGTKVTLFDRAGGINNSGNNLCKTVLTDSATNSIQNIAIAGAPWQGSFKPAQALSAFRGENANGTWILNAKDSVTIDTGSVRAFSLNVTGFSCTP